MKSMMITIPVEPGITLRAIRTDRFKTGCFSINLLQPHRRETASVDALLPSVLLHGTARYPDITAVTNRLDDLYGATLGTLVRRKGETRFVGFYADFIEDAFVPDGEAVFAPMLELAAQTLYEPYLENGCFCARYVESEKQPFSR